MSGWNYNEFRFGGTADEKNATSCDKCKSFAVNDGWKAFWIFLWVVGNLAAFGERAYFYAFLAPGKILANEDIDRYGKADAAYTVMGQGVVFARASAAALKLNCALILLPVCRTLLSKLRGTFVNNFLPIDSNIAAHKVIAWTLAFFAFMHGTAHYFNFINLNETTETQAMLTLFTATNGEPPTHWQLAYTTLPGITGHIVVASMILMYTTAVSRIRRPYFETFWYTHHLFIVFFGLLCAHGAAKILEEPTFWAWFVGPGFLYLIERILRAVRGSSETVLHWAKQHPSRVIELRMRKTGFPYKSGQYLFLNCPFISTQEWHPFTISSSPESEDYVSVHIRIVGDWTGDLAALLNPEKKQGVIITEPIVTARNGAPILRIDGPFGAASEEIFDFENMMLIGAGIGVTPFASILKTIRYRIQQQMETGVPLTIKKVYFYWISRDKEAFEWFGAMLKDLEANNINGFLEINIYLTSRNLAKNADDLRDIMHGADDAKDQFTSLEAKTNFGRPQWSKIFSEVAARHHGETVGCFFCGPPVLSNALLAECRAKTKPNGTKFKYHKENF